MINVDPFVASYNEDELKYASIGRPSLNSHILAHPKSTAPTVQQIFDAQDIFQQSHLMGLDFAKWALKGASIGLLIAAAKIPFRQFSQLTLRKISKHVLENKFGRLNVYYHMVVPDVLGGAILGMSYHAYFNVFGSDAPGDQIWWNRLVGGAIFGTAAVSLFARPNLWWMGFYGGGLLGLSAYTWAHANMAHTKGTVGSVILVPGLSDEQRARQARKDHIHALSLELPFKYNTIQEL